MNFKQYTNGTYEVVFEAKELAAVVNAVQILEEHKAQKIKESITAASSALVTQPSSPLPDNTTGV